LREVEQELHQLRQQVDAEQSGQSDPVIDPHSELLRTVFDVREALHQAIVTAEPNTGFRESLGRIDHNCSTQSSKRASNRSTPTAR